MGSIFLADRDLDVIRPRGENNLHRDDLQTIGNLTEQNTGNTWGNISAAPYRATWLGHNIE